MGLRLLRVVGIVFVGLLLLTTFAPAMRQAPAVDTTAFDAKLCAPGGPLPLGEVAVAIEPVPLHESLPSASLPVVAKHGTRDEWILVYQTGLIYAVSTLERAVTPRLVADLRDRVALGENAETGLVGFASPPAALDSPHAYVYYTAASSQSPSGLKARLARFTEVDGVMDPDSEEVLFELEKDAEYHHAGTLKFGPDNYLYVGTGDSWPNGRRRLLAQPYSQDRRSLAGKLLRIDVAQAPGYRAPQDNPFAGSDEASPEVYAWGLRNPWAFSHDAATGDLWLADVGRSGFEEVNRVTPGANYGWPAFEGRHCNDAELCATIDATPPFADFERQDLACIIGGTVYRGSELAGLAGRYIFGDCVYGTIWSLDTAGEEPPEIIAQVDSMVISFAEGKDGELLFTTYTGELYRLRTWASDGRNTLARRLSETGCVDPFSPQVTARHLRHYEVNFPAWNDGLEASRFLFLPRDTTIDAYAKPLVSNPRIWRPLGFTFPEQTVFVQHLRDGNTLIETRLLKHHAGGQWQGYSYEWLEDQSDAILVERGRFTTLSDGRRWTLPSRTECMSCHTRRGYRVLGFHPAQLDRELDDPVRVAPSNQLERFRAAGLITAPNKPTRSLPRIDDPTLGDTDFVLGYFHANCSMCHAAEGTVARSRFDARLNVPLSKKRIIDVPPSIESFDIEGARLVAPRDLGRSILLNRVVRKDEHRMPFIGNHQVDIEATKRISRWILSL